MFVGNRYLNRLSVKATMKTEPKIIPKPVVKLIFRKYFLTI